MSSRLMRIGELGFNFDAVVGWRYQTQPEIPNDRVLYLYLSGVSEAMIFEGDEADVLRQLLNVSSQNIAPAKPGGF